MVNTNELNRITDILGTVRDPEIPVLNVNDLGVIRDIQFVGDVIHVTITPTFNGCPAMKIIEFSIREALENSGYESVKIIEQISPPWTTEWINDAALQKLKDYGIAPPLGMNDKKVSCPRCNSEETVLVSEFGSTPCKSHFKCKSCLEPFDYFKCH